MADGVISVILAVLVVMAFVLAAPEDEDDEWEVHKWNQGR